MKTSKKLVSALAASVVLIGSLAALRSIQAPASERPPVPADPGARTVRLLRAQAFRIDQPYPHAWRSEQPEVRYGYLVALATDTDLLVPRQTFEPVLFAGAQTAERVNHGETSGRVVAIVPVGTRADGTPEWDLASRPFWFGTPELPERIDAARLQTELAEARTRGVRPPAPRELAEARHGRTSVLHLHDRVELDHLAADWIEELSPREADLVHGLRGL